MEVETKEPQSQDPPLVKEPGQPSVDKIVTPKPKTYSEADYQKAVSDEKTVSGRLKAELETTAKERDTFKSQAEQATSTLKETREHISNLESDIEALDEDEADPNKLSRLRKELREARGNVRQEVQGERDAIAELGRTTEAERLANAERWEANSERIARADLVEFTEDLVKIADEYEGDTRENFTKLKTACEKSGIKTKEGAEAIAETFLTKKPEEPDLLDDSGVNNGGSDLLSNLPIKERMEVLNKRVLSKMKV